jgi:hypothetical protein
MFLWNSVCVEFHSKVVKAPSSTAFPFYPSQTFSSVNKNDARSQPPSTFLRPSFWRSFTPHSVHMGTMWQECLKSVSDQRRHCAADSTTEPSRFTWADCSLGNKKYALHELQSGPATTYHLRPEAFSFVVLTGQSLRSDEVTTPPQTMDMCPLLNQIKDSSSRPRTWTTSPLDNWTLGLPAYIRVFKKDEGCDFNISKSWS